MQPTKNNFATTKMHRHLFTTTRKLFTKEMTYSEQITRELSKRLPKSVLDGTADMQSKDFSSEEQKQHEQIINDVVRQVRSERLEPQAQVLQEAETQRKKLAAATAIKKDVQLRKEQQEKSEKKQMGQVQVVQLKR